MADAGSNRLPSKLYCSGRDVWRQQLIALNGSPGWKVEKPSDDKAKKSVVILLRADV